MNGFVRIFEGIENNDKMKNKRKFVIRKVNEFRKEVNNIVNGFMLKNLL